MSAKKTGKQRPLSLAHGRPPSIRKTPISLSSKATRTLIRSHHQLQKALRVAENANDESAARALRQQIERQGGLKSYQQASLQGQSSDRGGDTSKVLLDWLRDRLDKEQPVLRMLEIGALSTTNACSKSRFFDVARIDLNSQSEGIMQQDFMERPLPKSQLEKFDVISLSLVLNYAPTAPGRGDMLKRTRDFLEAERPDAEGRAHDHWLPALFLVLPAPCVTNSRYMDENRLGDIMTSLGYIMIQRKCSSKLVYYLWQLKRQGTQPRTLFPKVEVNPGKERNNFSIVLD